MGGMKADHTSGGSEEASRLEIDAQLPTERDYRVYTLKDKHDRIPSEPEVHPRAITLAADEARRAGFGGGIVDLLQPATDQRRSWLGRDRLRYRPVLVRKRGRGTRALVKSQILDDALLHDLKQLCPSKQYRSMRQFATWILIQKGKPESEAYRLLAKRAPDFLAAEHSLEWLARLLGKKTTSR